MQRRHASQNNLRSRHQRNVRRGSQQNSRHQSNHLFAPIKAPSRRRHRQTASRRQNNLLFFKKPQNRERPSRRRRFLKFIKKRNYIVAFKITLNKNGLAYAIPKVHQKFHRRVHRGLRAYRSSVRTLFSPKR